MAVDNILLFRRIYIRAKKELVPKLVVGPKSAFRIHVLINWILNIVYPKNKKNAYRENYTTTLGFTVAMASWVGDKVERFKNWETLCHEIKHARQAKKWSRVLFGYLYLWPISQGIVLLLGGWVGVIWVPGWWKAVYLASWLIVSGIHFIPQLPDPWRKRWEFQAYSISMHLRFLTYGTIGQKYLDHLVENFHSMMYYIMAPNEKKIREELTRLAALIESGKSPVDNEPIIKIAEEEYQRLVAGGSN